MDNKTRAAMQQALEALERWKEWDERTQQEMHDDIDDEAIAALREALAEQAEQEPVAYGFRSRDGVIIECEILPDDYYSVPLYAAPVRIKDLTDDEIDEIGKSYFDEWSFGFARAVIAKFKEKNK